tara:strand:- start:166 stop:888 length:723 start_codon:yes stop_codon:yes gene_type:complete
MESKNYNVNKILSDLKSQADGMILGSETSGCVEIYKSFKDRSNQLVLECGVNKGFSSSLFTALSENNNSTCYSVDILDCKDVVKSNKWFFFQSDDRDEKKILTSFPKIQTLGIDILYIDSLHTPEHVREVLYTWYPYLNKNSLVFIDDIDSYIYKKGNRKDSIMNEVYNDGINQFIHDFAESNRLDVSLVQYYYKNGIAKLSKSSDKGSLPIKINIKKRLFGQIAFIKLSRKIKNYLRRK